MLRRNLSRYIARKEGTPGYWCIYNELQLNSHAISCLHTDMNRYTNSHSRLTCQTVQIDAGVNIRMQPRHWYTYEIYSWFCKMHLNIFILTEHMFVMAVSCLKRNCIFNMCSKYVVHLVRIYKQKGYAWISAKLFIPWENPKVKPLNVIGIDWLMIH